MRTGFFDYYHRGLREGLTETESYKWAITEDMWSADDEPLAPEQATADGMCYHPDCAIEVVLGHSVCNICGQCTMYTQPDSFYEPVKIPTRREIAATVFTQALQKGT